MNNRVVIVLAGLFIGFCQSPMLAQQAVPAEQGVTPPVESPISIPINEPLPRPTGYNRFVVDVAGVLTPNFKQALTQALYKLDQQGQSQMTVVVLPNTDRELSDLAPVWFNAWGIGHGDRDDGILVLINQSRVANRVSGNRVFVAVGTGVQGTLPDGRVGQLIRDFARPGLNAGDTQSALQGLMPQLIDILSKEPIKPASPTDGGPLQWVMLLIMALFFFNMLFGRRRGGFLFMPGLGGFGGGFSGGGWGDGGGSFGGGSSDGGGAGD